MHTLFLWLNSVNDADLKPKILVIFPPKENLANLASMCIFKIKILVISDDRTTVFCV